MNKEDVIILDQQTLYDDRYKLIRYTLKHKLFQGGFTQPFQRDVFARLSSTAILPYDPARDEVVLIEQFRAPMLSLGEHPWLMEIVAGVCDTNESPREVAIREAQEEAGCSIGAAHLICEYLPSPGVCNEVVYLFCGKTDTQNIGGIHGLTEENENIRACVVPFEEAFGFIAQGRIKTSPAILALQWLKLNRTNLRKDEQWVDQT